LPNLGNATSSDLQSKTDVISFRPKGKP
jgi:hypothetical protein